jgi:hypothetical protein
MLLFLGESGTVWILLRDANCVLVVIRQPSLTIREHNEALLELSHGHELLFWTLETHVF